MNKHWKALVGIIAICLLLSLMSNAMAQDPNTAKETPKEPNSAAPQETPKESPKEPPKEQTKEQTKEKNLIIGILTAVKDNDGNVVEMTITAHKDLKYKVVINEKSKEMGQSFTDKRVRVEGTIEIKGDVKWLTVDTFSELKSRADAKPGAKSKAKPAAKPAPKSRK
jgi:hypothetical protein